MQIWLELVTILVQFFSFIQTKTASLDQHLRLRYTACLKKIFLGWSGLHFPKLLLNSKISCISTTLF